MAGGKRDAAAREAVDRVFAARALGPDARAEDITPDEFVRLEQAFAAACGRG
jgi:hypothetical protein